MCAAGIFRDDFEFYAPGPHAALFTGPFKTWEAVPTFGPGPAEIQVYGAGGPQPNLPGFNTVNLQGTLGVDGHLALAQSVALVPGNMYTVSFLLGGSTSLTELQNDIIVTIGSSNGGASWSNTFTLLNTDPYATYTATFTPSIAGTLVLQFHNIGTDNEGAFLDDVSVDCAPAISACPLTTFGVPPFCSPACNLVETVDGTMAGSPEDTTCCEAAAGEGGCYPCDATEYATALIGGSAGPLECAVCLTPAGSPTCGVCDYDTGTYAASPLPPITAGSQPSGVVEFLSDASVLTSPHYAGGLGTPFSPAVIRLPGCLTVLLHVANLSMTVEFQDLGFWAHHIPDYGAYGIPTECRDQAAAFCIHDLAGGHVNIRDVHLRSGMRLLNIFDGSADILQTPTKGIIRSGTIGSIFEGGHVKLLGVTWNGFDATTLVERGVLDVVASELNAASSWCRLDHTVTQAPSQLGRNPLQGIEDQLHIKMLDATTGAKVNLLDSRLGGAFVGVHASDSEILMAGNEFGCSAWIVDALSSTVTSIANDFVDLAVPFRLVGSDDVKSLRNGDNIETVLGPISTPPTPDRPFFSLCDDFFATFPAVVISDSPVSLYGSNFREGFPIQASIALRDAALYGGLDNTVPVPDNVRLVHAIHDPTGTAQGPCAPLCVNFLLNPNLTSQFGLGADTCAPCGTNVYSTAGSAAIDTCGNCRPVDGIFRLDLCDPCQPYGTLDVGIARSTTGASPCQCDPTAYTSSGIVYAEAGLDMCNSCDPAAFSNAPSAGWRTGLDACNPCDPKVHMDGFTHWSAHINLCNPCNPHAGVTAQSATWTGGANVCNPCNPHVYTQAQGTTQTVEFICKSCASGVVLDGALDAEVAETHCDPCRPNLTVDPVGSVSPAVCDPCQPAVALQGAGTAAFVSGNLCTCDPTVRVSTSASSTTVHYDACECVPPDPMNQTWNPRQPTCVCETTVPNPTTGFDACDPCDPMVYVAGLGVGVGTCENCKIHVHTPVGTTSIPTCASFMPSGSEAAASGAGPSSPQGLATSGGGGIGSASLGCSLPFYCLLDGTGTVRQWSGTTTNVMGVINVPLVAPDLTSVHYLLLAPDSLDGELAVDGVAVGFYNFAVRLTTPGTVAFQNVGAFEPGTSSGGYGFLSEVSLPSWPASLVGQYLQGKAVFPVPTPTSSLGDIKYYYQEDGFGNVCAGVCPMVSLGVPATASPMATMMACVTGIIEMPSSGLAVKLVSERAATNCGITGTGFPGVQHVFSDGTISVGLEFHDRESRRMTVDLYTITERNFVSAKIGLSEKAATGRFAYAGGPSLAHADFVANFGEINVGTHTIAVAGKTEDLLTLTYTPEAYVDPGPMGLPGVGESALAVSTSAFSQVAFADAGPGPGGTGIGGIGFLQALVASENPADASAVELTLDQLRSRHTITVHHKAPEFKLTYNSPQAQDQHITFSASLSTNPGPITVEGDLKHAGSYSMTVAGTTEDPIMVDLNVESGWVEDLTAHVPFASGSVHAYVDVISKIHVEWKDTKVFSIDTPEYPQAYPVPKSITAIVTFGTNEVTVTYSGIVGPSHVDMDQKEYGQVFHGKAQQQSVQNLAIRYNSLATPLSPEFLVDISQIEFIPTADGAIGWEANLEYAPDLSDFALVALGLKDQGNTLVKGTIVLSKGSIGDWSVFVRKGTDVNIDGIGRGIGYLTFVPGDGTLSATLQTPHDPAFYSGSLVDPSADLKINNGEVKAKIKFLNLAGPGVLKIESGKDADNSGVPGGASRCSGSDFAAELELEAAGATGSWTISKAGKDVDIHADVGFFRKIDFGLPCGQFMKAEYLDVFINRKGQPLQYLAPLLSPYFPTSVKSTLNIQVQEQGRYNVPISSGDWVPVVVTLETILNAEGVNALTLCQEGDCEADFTELNMDTLGTFELRTDKAVDFIGVVTAVLEIEKSVRTVVCSAIGNAAVTVVLPNQLSYKWDWYVLAGHSTQVLWEGPQGDLDHSGDTTMGDVNPLTAHSGGGPARPSSVPHASYICT